MSSARLPEQGYSSNPRFSKNHRFSFSLIYQQTSPLSFITKSCSSRDARHFVSSHLIELVSQNSKLNVCLSDPSDLSHEHRTDRRSILRWNTRWNTLGWAFLAQVTYVFLFHPRFIRGWFRISKERTPLQPLEPAARSIPSRAGFVSSFLSQQG